MNRQDAKNAKKRSGCDFVDSLRLAGNQQLNFRQVVFRIAAEDHPRPFVVDLTGRNLDLVALGADVVQDLGVRLTKLVVRPLVQQRDAATAGELPDRDSIDRLAITDRHARLDIGVRLAVFRIVMQHQRLTADVAPEASAEAGEDGSAVSVSALHANAGDQDRIGLLLLDLKQRLAHEIPRFLFCGQELVQRAHDLAIALDLGLKEGPLSLHDLAKIGVVPGTPEDRTDLIEG